MTENDFGLDRMFHSVIAITKVKFHPPPPRKAWYFTDYILLSVLFQQLSVIIKACS